MQLVSTTATVIHKNNMQLNPFHNVLLSLKIKKNKATILGFWLETLKGLYMDNVSVYIYNI